MENSTLKLRDSVLIGGVPVRPFASVKELAEQIISAEGAVWSTVAVAINAEKIAKLFGDENLKKLFPGDALYYPDGAAIVRTMKTKGVSSARTAGADLWLELMGRCAASAVKVYLVGGAEDVNSAVAQKLRKDLGVNVVGRRCGYGLDVEQVAKDIAEAGAQVVTVALGSPAQELFIARCRASHRNAFYMGVGGTYDVYVGRVRRAPRWMQSAGLEWLYRLMRQPSRITRQGGLVRYAWLHLTRQL